MREQLSDFELTAGQWRKKASVTTEAASDRWDAFVTSLQEQYSATREQLQEWLSSLGQSTEQLRERFNSSDKSDDDTQADMSHEGFSHEAFNAWLSRRDKDES